MKWCVILVATLLCIAATDSGLAGPRPLDREQHPVSFHRDVFPVLQTHCFGCHQAAKASGDYVMTTFQQLLAGGESGSAAIVPGNPDESYLVELITPANGEAEMPSGKPALETSSLELIRTWIEQGAEDDSPPSARRVYDLDHPPTYTSLPVVTSLACSPDGRLLAVAGFHEVLLHRLNGSGLAARLIGTSERIESVAFSPDGTKLAVVGGLPARRGELQVWDVADPPEENTEPWRPRLLNSIPLTFDTIYGGSWSPDGKVIAVGCGDNTLRAFDAETGQQVLFQGAHNDWVLDTVFSVDGSHLISVSRDMTAKLTEVATERFVDNITSITPDALKGGIQAVARHPMRDEIVIGGSDGIPKVYRVFRQTERRIGDDANLIRRLPPLRGRVFSVEVSPDGRRIVSGSSLDATGQVAIDSYEFDTALPDDVKQIMSKVSTSRSAEENKRLADYVQEGIRRVALVDVPAGVFAVTFVPQAAQVVAAGSDGIIRVIDAETGTIDREFPAVPTLAEGVTESGRDRSAADPDQQQETAESWPEGLDVAQLQVEPVQVQLSGEFDYVQLLVTATLRTGEQLDVTRMVTACLADDLAAVSRRGVIVPRRDGDTALQLTLAGQTISVPVSVRGSRGPFRPDYIRDIAPIIAKMGCNQGTCHGSAKGKNGFKLSLRGYDAVADLRALTDDHASRRANVASPENSLMLLKATGTVPHVGGQVTKVGEDYYEMLRQWLAGGAKLDPQSAPVTSITLSPPHPTVQSLQARQQVRVVATYADGRSRDVTREAYISSGNTEVATAGEHGLMTAVRRGEAPVLARFQGAYAATTLTVMGDRTGFAWEDPPAYNRIDELVAAKWKRLKTKPSPVCSDAEFLRRVSLDVTGLPPSVEVAQAFFSDARDSRAKRDELVDRLIGSEAFVDYWTNKWADLLQVNRKFLGPEGAAAYRNWIRGQIAENRPYDEFVRSVVTATGSNRENPAASYYKILRTPADALETTTQLFLAIRFNCNKCHDHPFERWTQDQYYQTAAYFSQVAREPDPESKGRAIGGSAVEGATPLYEIVGDKSQEDVINLRTGQPAKPVFPFECTWEAPEQSTRREQLAAWLTSPDNPYFAKSLVNRLWGYMFGVGIIEPIDDVRAGNPATNPELLEYLTHQFIETDFDMRHVLRMICTSRTYQLSVATNPWNEDDNTNYAHALARRLPAEVLFDAIHVATGSISKIPGVPEGTRAVQLPDAGIELPSGFLSTLGRPARESACECERASDIQLGPVMAMISGPVVAQAIADPKNELATLVDQQPDDSQLVDAVVLRILNRHAAQEEIEAAQQLLTEIDADHRRLASRLEQEEQSWVTRKSELETQRKENLSRAETDLKVYEEKIAPQVAEQEKQRADKIEQAAAVLQEYESKLDQHFQEWAEAATPNTEWHLLRPTALSASNGAQLTVQQDRSVRAEGKAEKGVYNVTFSTRLTGITAIRLETLPVEGLKGGGPGLPENGNFVVTEIELQAADAASPSQLEPVALTQGVADFTQAGFDIQTAIDGVKQDQLGWAVAPAGGTVHWATFQTAQPIGHDAGTILQIALHQYHEAKDHRLAHFRVSVATSATPVGLSLPESLAAVRATDSQTRSESQKKLVADYFHGSNATYRQLLEGVTTAQTPVPIDPGVQRRRALVQELQQSVPDDPALVQLRRDVEESTKQVNNRRLTGVQDLAWALINSPAFLFNH